MRTKIDKGILGEDFIHQIAYTSYLKFWCYPNPKDELGDRKEICDLLVTFKDSVLLICVKNFEFKGTYEKYFRKTIEKDIRQLTGAERKLLNVKNSIFIKHPDKPIEEFNRAAVIKVFRIVVHLGENVRFYPMFERNIKDQFIHIFDKDTFLTIITELDTIPDLIDYLEKKEQAFNNAYAIILPKDEYDFDYMTFKQFQDYTSPLSISKTRRNILILGSEHDLLAQFLTNSRQMPTHLISEKYDWLVLQVDGAWQNYQQRKEVKLKKVQDKYSYFIDTFVRNELLNSPNDSRIKLAKELLSFSRFDRRVLSKTILSFLDENRRKGNHNGVSRRFWKQNGIGFVLVLFPSSWQDDMINPILDLALKSFVIYDNYGCQKMIIIANRFDLQQFRFGIVENIVPFDKELEKSILEDVNKLGWFTDIKYTKGNESEYPDN